tara:strand:+ start:190 stop:840 length:651 start_codon:yes stop_codon:yes gene_type:complete
MNIEINVPTSLSEITLGQYQKYLKIADENPDSNFLSAKMIEIFCGISLSESYRLKVSSVAAICDILEELLDQKPELVDRFDMNGVQYGMIPDMDDMSLGEYIDLDNNVSQWEQMHTAMNVMYRPIQDSKGDKYNLVEYNPLSAEMMRDMPMSAVTGSLFFLLTLGIELSNHTILYSNQEGMSDSQQRLISTESGDGINHFMDSLQEILANLKISLN